MESEQSEDWVYEGSWHLVIMPEDFCINSLAQAIDLFDDLQEFGADEHAQFPTAVFYQGDE